ncbi:hypothetical protein EDC04DRAFT_2865429 [Pisolithus marmoratus]|nr:hypothetical protein EDC04DRAFT_2865429 [Pisolithus marmoratus]
MLLEIWATSLIKLGSNPLFANHMDLYHVIDSMSVGAVKWENFKITYKCKCQDGQNADEQDELIELAGLGGQDGQDEPDAPWMFNVYDVWYRDPCQVIHNLLGCTNIKDEMDFIPYQEFDAMNKQRHWEDFMLGDWAWEEADKIISINSSTAGATLAPIILGSDKTTMDYYPLYLSIRNVHNTTHHVHCDAVVLIGFLAMPKTCRENANTPAFHKFKKQLFHSLLACILHSLCAAMTVPETVLFSDQYYCHVIYSFTAYIADYEEQVLLSSIMHGWCLKCLAHWVDLDQDALQHCCEHTELIIKELDLQTLWDKYSIDRTIVPFTSEFPHADIQRMLLLDMLHQLIKGGFKDQLVDWVEKYLIHVHGRSAAEKILDDIDQRIAAVYIAAIEGYVPEEIILTFSSFLKFCYLVHRNVITEPTLIAIKDTLTSFHSHCGIFHDTGVVLTFSLPQQHAMKHYPYLICQFGMPNGLCSSITKSKHIKAVKWPYWHTNHFQALRQILRINERLDKFAAVQADFKKHGMLGGNCLDLAIELNIPQFHDILQHFLQSQLQHDNHNPEDVPLDECPFYDESVNVYNSVSSTFYAPSDMSGLHGMHCEHIRCSPTWRNEGSHSLGAKTNVYDYDCVFVITNPHMKGMLGLDVTCVLCFFSFKHLGMEYPCAVICWFDHVGDGPNNTGMWVVHMCNAQDIAIIHINTIYHAAQLIPVYASQHGIDPVSIKPNESYNKFQFYYVNKFADHHAFEIVS